MARSGLNIERYGPLAELDHLLDRSGDVVDLISYWYPEVAERYQALCGAVHWEINRLAWEVEFAEQVRADERQASEAARRKAARRRARDIAAARAAIVSEIAAS